MKDTMIQWHPGFVAAMHLELAENLDELIFEKEYNLNTKPLLIDLLVIKKESSHPIQNEIGELFRAYNIMEYKSPKDSLNIDTLYKIIAYVCLYKSYGSTVDGRKAEDMTLSIVREAKPRGLFQYLKEAGIQVEPKYKGIYYIRNQMLFPIQIIVTKELEKETHIWLRALTDQMEEQEMRKLIEQIQRLKRKQEREFADSILEVSIKANKQVLDELRGDEEMCQALLEFMEPEIQKREKQAKEQGIRQLIETLQELGYEEETVKSIVRKNYSLSKEEIEKYM